MMKSTQKKYYRIGEVAEILNLPLSTLRFWEKNFTIISPRRNGGGTRFYTPSDIEKIRMVNYLVKEKGLHLAAAQQAIKQNSEGVTSRFMAIERLKDIRRRLVDMHAAVDLRLKRTSRSGED